MAMRKQSIVICDSILLTWLFMFESCGDRAVQKVKYIAYNMAVFKMLYVGALCGFSTGCVKLC